MVGGIPHLPNAFIYAVYIFSAIVLLVDDLSVNKVWAAFLLFIPLSIILASPDEVFQPWLRYGLFVFMYLVASGILQSNRAIKFRRQSLNITLTFCVLLSVGSFFAYFLGINLFEDRFYGGYILDYEGAAGNFSGLMTHSMLLGPVSGIAMVFLYYKATMLHKRWIWILIVMCAGSVLFSSSRAAIVAAAIGFMVTTYYTSENRAQFMKRLVVVILALVVTFPLWRVATSAVAEKQEQRLEAGGGVLDSRSNKMVCRIEEFQSSPIWGIGFSSVDTNKDVYNPLTGTIEPGTSWLAVLSMTGIIGFILFLSIFITCFKQSLSNQYSIQLTGLLAFFAVHLLVEGYVFAASNPVCYMFWLILGCSFDYKNHKDDNYEFGILLK